MFDAGFTELLLIMVIALLVVGPERLPGLARKVGHWIGKARSYFNSVRSDIERELRADELKQMLSQQQEEIQRLKTIVEDTGHELEEDLKETEQLVTAEKETSTPSAANTASASGAGDEAEAEPEKAPAQDNPEETPAASPDEQRR